MSRLIVKNLPKTITDSRLRELFNEKGLITDLKLMYTKNGVFRGFAFIGYKHENEAQIAKDYFHNTFLGLSKIQVETCSSLGDTSKPRSWSKYAKDSSSYQAEEEKLKKKQESVEKVNKKFEKSPGKEEPENQNNYVKKKLDEFEKLKNDPQFFEFIELNQKGGTQVTWNNDVGNVEKACLNQKLNKMPKNLEIEDVDMPERSENDQSSEKEMNSEEKTKKKKGRKKVEHKQSDLEYLKSKMIESVEGTNQEKDIENRDELKLKTIDMQNETKIPGKKSDPKYTVKLKNLPYKCKQKAIKEFFSPLEAKSIKLPFNVKGIAYVHFQTEKEMKQALVKHHSYLDGHRISVVIFNSEKDCSEKTAEVKAKKWEQNAKELEAEETIAESGRLFIRNLSYTTTEDEVEKYFSKYGPLAEVNVPIDKFARRTKGYAMITYVIPENSVKAFTEEDGKVFQGRMLHILPGKAMPEQLKISDDMPYKQQKSLKDKARSGSDHNWNTLFLGMDAVARSMAERYQVEKRQILDPESSKSLAVRMALGETQLIAETREFLLQNNVDLDVFSQPKGERSKTTILVKNLPERTSAESLHEIFVKHGEIGRIVLPPHGITAIVEFLEPSEARSAFRNLAYTKFQHVPLYLEWAPESTFSKLRIDTPESTKEGESASFDTQENDATHTKEFVNEDEDEPENESTIFVKNLNFDTTDEVLFKHFERCGIIHSASVSKKKDMNDPENILSMGFGFIQYKRKLAAQKAIKELQNSMLDGHALELKISHRTIKSSSNHKKSSKEIIQKSTKILVRNIPFQSKETEIRELFSVFGELKSVRLPRKLDGNYHRGFGFVEFYTKPDAKRAFNALCQSTHLFGRRLVLEWADTEESMDDLRKRTADHFHGSKSGISKKMPKSTAVFEDIVAAD